MEMWKIWQLGMHGSVCTLQTDLERMEYTKFRSDSMKIEIMKEKPNYESEVLNFASRFI